MTKKALFVISILILVVLSGCAFIEYPTELVIKNHGDSGENIDLLSIRQYVSGDTSRGVAPANALDSPLAPGKSIKFTIAPFSVANNPLKVEILYSGGTYKTVFITYDNMQTVELTLELAGSSVEASIHNGEIVIF